MGQGQNCNGHFCGACDTRVRGSDELTAPTGVSRQRYETPNQPLKPTSSNYPAASDVKMPLAAAGKHSGEEGYYEFQDVDSAVPTGGGDTYSTNYFDREACELQAQHPKAETGKAVRKFKRHTFQTGATYSGQWLGQQRDGFGIQQWPDGAGYKGQWQKDCAVGRGLFRHSNGDVYLGEWSGNVAHGNGTYRHQGERTTYQGEFRDDLQDGHGVETWQEGARFEGEFFRGKKHGFGIYLWPDGSLYAGGWRENKIEGTGEYTGKDGRRFAGSWQSSVMHGMGRSTWPDGRSYEGMYAKDQKDGFGIFAWTDGRRYEGFWRNGRQHGIGRLCLGEDGASRHAEWADGIRMM